MTASTPSVASSVSEAPLAFPARGDYRAVLLSEEVFGQAGGGFEEPGTPLGTFVIGEALWGGDEVA